MADSEPVDSAAPWTIKSVPTATREAVTKAARQEGVTVGQWLERRVADWLADGSPVAVAPAAAAVAPAPDVGGLAQLIEAATAAAGAAGMPLPPQFARDAVLTARKVMRQARGVPPPASRKPAPARLAPPES